MTHNFFESKVAVITGGSRNIGKAVATALVEQEAKVVIGDIIDTEGQETIEELNSKAGKEVAIFQHTDVTKYKDLTALFQLAESSFGGVDLVFLNAGIAVNHDVLLDPLDDEQDEKILKVNTAGIIKGTKVGVRHLAKRGAGAIVITGSTLGLEPASYTSIYNASKGAVIAWARSFQHLQNICSVRINSVCPHAVDTEFLWGFPDLSRKIFEGVAPTAEISTVVKAVLLLMEDQNRNGQVLTALPGNVIEVEEAPKIMAKTTQHLGNIPLVSPEVISELEAKYKQDFDGMMKSYFMQ
ncbi:hypothetical protein BDB00DRAFT_812789 [Zychaea mexicana]|uniref:uncharacterized protein n=1 Tax=Zychaea mexicana TaxID=64656 RepID=UPI0022FF434A|nr:uncharacterized protein BDB00DRAFT_812789 [Zychaea mexicana]KAI9495645.1 hypothetical protein BDB00DRAFT_812789 [Zychaea mexicana]